MKGESLIINENNLIGQHKAEHEPYEYVKYEITPRGDFDQCNVAVYEIPPKKSNSPDIITYPDSDKTGIIIHNQSSMFFKNDDKVNYYDGENI